MAAKSREINVLAGAIGTGEDIISGNVVTRTKHTANIRGRQETIGKSHAFPPSLYQRRANPLLDRGGSFQMLKRTIETNAPSVKAEYLYGIPGSQNGWRYQGLVMAHTLNPNLTGLPTPPLGSTIDAMGAVGWNRYKPTAPQGGVSQFLGELRELPTLPRLLLLKGQAYRLKDLGSDYLNVRFGWEPFVKELRKFIITSQKVDKILRQLSRDNGGWVRRRGPISEDTSITTSESQGYFTLPSLVSYLYDGIQTREVKQETTTKWWFSGKFKYYIPTGNSPEDIRKRSNQLARIVYGAELSPRLVWQLMPWSWMADWVTSAGAVISNLMDYQDGLVAQYAYVMMNKSIKTTYTVRGKFKGHGSFQTSQTYIDEIKLRYAANPFGFGILDGDLSPYQLSILGALGLSRGLR